jgi:hypothetical protein
MACLNSDQLETSGDGKDGEEAWLSNYIRGTGWSKSTRINSENFKKIFKL